MGVLMAVFAALVSGCALPTGQAAPSGGGGQMLQLRGGAGGQQMVELKGAKITPAPGLPAGEPDAAGLYLRRADSSIFIGTGEIEMRVMIPEEGADPVAEASANGPTLEVVVNRNTEIYVDTTAISMEARRDGLTVQQTVELLDSLDTLLESVSKTDTLSVWGEQTGDRILARVIVYRPFDMPLPPR